MNKRISYLASLIDSTLLSKNISKNKLEKFCSEAIINQFYAVCLNPEMVRQAFDLLKETNVLLVTVAGFPNGTESTKVKCSQVKNAVRLGADEVDVVMNFDLFFSGKYNETIEDILNTVIAAKTENTKRFLVETTVVKVIIETSYLKSIAAKENKSEDYYIKLASELASDAQADFIKTSTGMHPAGGVQKGDVKLIRSFIPESVKVKAAGGIKTFNQVSELIDEGVNRIGTSSAGTIIKDFYNT
ncbi:deoxyribose-phosphate aldolase [candidate division KSB1 bacterium]